MASYNSTLTRVEDYFGRDKNTTIVLDAVLRPNRSDLDQIFQEIGVEFPQVREALPDPQRYRFLRVRVVYSGEPVPIAYIDEISVLSEIDEPTTGRTLVKVPSEAAREIASRLRELGTLEHDGTMLEPFAREFDADDWERLRQHPRGAAYIPLRDQVAANTFAEAIAAGVDPAALVEATNAAQAERVAAQTQLEHGSTPDTLDRAEVYAMIDSLSEMGRDLDQADPHRLQDWYEALRLEMIYGAEERAVDVTIRPAP